AWAGTAAFLPVFAAVLLVFDPAQRIARLFGQRPQEYVAGALQMALVAAFRLCGTRLAVERAPGFVPGRSYVVVSNHQSMFDIALLGTLLFRSFPKYISKRSLGRWIPSVSFNLRRGGHVLIDRGDAASALATIGELGRRVQAGGVSAVIFPEGTRSRAGELREFRRAGTLALLEAAPDVPGVPPCATSPLRAYPTRQAGGIVAHALSHEPKHLGPYPGSGAVRGGRSLPPRAWTHGGHTRPQAGPDPATQEPRHAETPARGA